MRRTVMGRLAVVAVAAGMLITLATPARAGGNDIDYLAYTGSSCDPLDYWVSFQTMDTSGRARSLWLYVQGPDPANPGSAKWIFEGHMEGKGPLSVTANNLDATLGWTYMAEAMLWVLNNKGEPTKLLDSTTIYHTFNCPT